MKKLIRRLFRCDLKEENKVLELVHEKDMIIIRDLLDKIKHLEKDNLKYLKFKEKLR